MSADRMGYMVTFYSYKGGVGRTLALADVGVFLARMGHRVLMVDWDLEAPGLSAYFPHEPHPGLLEGLPRFRSVPPGEFARATVPVALPGAQGTLALMPAGRLDDAHAARVQALSWDALYADGFGPWLEDVRRAWQRDWDFILVDSRTGVSDAGSVCTVQLPEILVLLFTPNRQSIEGSLRVARQARAGQRKLQLDRARLRVVPVLTRLDNTELQARRRWEMEALEGFASLVDLWSDAEARSADLLRALSVPYVPYWAFGERIPALEGDTSDKLGVERAHESLALLLANGLSGVPRLLDARETLLDGNDRYDVFLSHSRADTVEFNLLKDALEARGLRVASDARLSVGDDWALELSVLRRQSDAYVVLVGAHDAPGQVEEIAEIAELNQRFPDRKVVPVRLAGVPWSELPVDVRRYVGLERDAFDDTEALAGALFKALSR